MVPETLTFMPNGDITLILIRHVMKEVETPPALEQTPLDEDGQLEAAPAVEDEEPTEPDESVLFFAPDPPEGMNGPLYPPPPRAARGSNASSRRDRSTSPPASFWASLKRQTARAAEPSKDEQPINPPTPAKKLEQIVVSSHEVHCVVSSRHMMLASQYFQTILSGNFSEAITLRAKGHVSIPLLADLDTMIVLLDIVHGASRKVPRQVSLEVLSKLAVLVSSFGMLETVQFFSDTWIDNFQREGLPKSYNENVLPFVFVFWVFDRPTEFKDMTRLTQWQCDEKLDEDVRDVPIPHSIIDAIKRDREFAIETAITVIHALITRYMDDQTICDGTMDEEFRYACDAMVLGSLMKSARKIGIWPKSEAPFNGRKFKDLVHAIRSIKILDVCNKSSCRRFQSLGLSSNCHGLEDSIEASMESIGVGLDGLELSDFAKKGEDYNSGLQTLLPAPSEEVLKEQTKEGTENNAEIYMKAEVEEVLTEELKVPQREYSVPESIFTARTNASGVEEPVQEAMRVTPKQYLREFQEPEARKSPEASAQEVKEPAQQEMRFGRKHYSREVHPEARFFPRASLQEVEEPVEEEMSVGSKQYPRESQQPQTRLSPRANVQDVEVPAQEEMKVGRKQYSREFQQPEARFSPRASVQEVEVPVQEEIRMVPKHYSRDFQQPEERFSPRAIAQEVEELVKEEVKASPRDSPSQEAIIPARFIAKTIDDPLREEVKSPSREEVRVLADRRLNKNASFAKIPRDEVKSPVKELQVAPRVASIEEMVEEVSDPERGEVKPVTVEARETLNEGLVTTDGEEIWAPPPQNFKMRKSKKKFSTRF